LTATLKTPHYIIGKIVRANPALPIAHEGSSKESQARNFAFGRGSNFEAIAASIDAGRLDARHCRRHQQRRVCAGTGARERTRLEALFIPSKGKVREQFDAEIVEALKASDVGLVVLAGFLRIFSTLFTSAYPNLILNIHPSLLPSFPGLEVQQQAIDYGVKFSGCTVHVVNDVLDGGPIVRQAVVPVLDSDTADVLSARILKEEHRIFSEAIDLVLSGKCDIQGRRVISA
jgi:phosphoribosylglycinamide formyltransferase-1